MSSTYEFLKPVLGDELYTQFDEKMSAAEGISLVNLTDGQYIPKAKFDEERNTNKGYKSQIDELNQKLAELQKAVDGNETLKGQIAQLQSDITARDAALKKQQLEYTIKDAVRNNKAKNADVVMKMIDQSKITENNGQFYGLNEQIEALKQTDAYLFEDKQASSGGVDPHNDPNSQKPGTNEQVNDMIRRAAGR